MATRSYTTDIELYIGSGTTRHEATVTYDYQRACGDGWNEPRTPEFCSPERVEITVNGKVHDVYPLLSAGHIEQIGAECLEHEREEREYAKECAAEARADFWREAA